jgi:hypothetical protein
VVVVVVANDAGGRLQRWWTTAVRCSAIAGACS